VGLNSFPLCRLKNDKIIYRKQGDKIKLKSFKVKHNIGLLIKWKIDGKKENR